MGASTARGAPEKSKTPGEEGFRVFRVELNRRERRELERFYRRLVQRDPSLPKGAFRYLGSWEEEKAAVLEMREQAGKRTPPKRDPAYYLLVKIIKNGKRIHGSKGASVIIDLDRGELRIPCAGIQIHLKPSLLKALEEELSLVPKPELVAQLTCRGRLRIIARRSPPKWWVVVREESDDFRDIHLLQPFVVVGVDVNSRHGTTLLGFRIDEDGVRLILRRRLRPPRRKLKLIMLLQSFADLAENAKRGHLSPELREVYSELRRELPERLRSLPLTPTNCRKVVRCTHRANTKRVESWERSLSFLFRRLCRRCERVIVAIDLPNYESLKGTRNQITLLRVRKRLQVLCCYEGAFYKEVHVSGRQCPLCGGWGLSIPRERGEKARRFECLQCSLIWDRDFCACFKAVVAALPWLHEAMVKWLKEHPTVLCPAIEQ